MADTVLSGATATVDYAAAKARRSMEPPPRWEAS